MLTTTIFQPSCLLGGYYFYRRILESYGDFTWLEYLSLAVNDLHRRITRALGNFIKARHRNKWSLEEKGDDSNKQETLDTASKLAL